MASIRARIRWDLPWTIGLSYDREHLFEQIPILPEHLFGVNHIHKIELVFASSQSRC
jgi:hypothetical protein